MIPLADLQSGKTYVAAIVSGELPLAFIEEYDPVKTIDESQFDSGAVSVTVKSNEDNNLVYVINKRIVAPKSIREKAA